jgi:hypothetical protein
MDDFERKLIFYIKELSIAKTILSQFKAVEIESMDLQLALCERLGIESMEPVDLLEKELSSDEMIELLLDFSFTKPEVIAQITFEESILPEGIPKLLTEKTIKVKGEVWVIHKNDVDPFPSTPHAHNYESGISLHLGTGEFFQKRRSKGFLNCKKLVRIRENIKGHELPVLDERCD